MRFWIEESAAISYDEFVNDLKNGKPSFSLVGYNYFFDLIFGLSLECNFNNIDELQTCLIENSSSLIFQVETSGTTSAPKKVSVLLKNCIRQVKVKKADYPKVWGNCYPFESFACTQVFFQSFFNNETIVYCFDKDFKKVNNILLREKVTNLTCTPTFLNMLILSSEVQNHHVKTITTGGEKLSNKVLSSYKQTFPNAKYVNIYASTEAGSLLYSNSDIFSISEKYKNQIKIIKSELVIHKSLINKAENNKIIDDWFYTGDEVEILNNESFRFKSRKSSYINTGGYRVNPIEIEEIILQIGDVKDVRVFGKSNSILGTIICAEVISPNMNSKEIKTILKNKLEEYKIPQIIKVVEELSLTHSGKKSRK